MLTTYVKNMSDKVCQTRQCFASCTYTRPSAERGLIYLHVCALYVSTSSTHHGVPGQQPVDDTKAIDNSWRHDALRAGPCDVTARKPTGATARGFSSGCQDSGLA